MSFLDVTLGADVPMSLIVVLGVLISGMTVSTGTAVVIGTATTVAARSYLRYQRIRVH